MLFQKCCLYNHNKLYWFFIMDTMARIHSDELVIG